MNKAGLISVVAEKNGIAKRDAEKLVNSVLDTVVDTLAQGEKVQLVGFGVFETGKRKVRTGGAFGGGSGETQETVTLKFRAGKLLREAIAACRK